MRIRICRALVVLFLSFFWISDWLCSYWRSLALHNTLYWKTRLGFGVSLVLHWACDKEEEKGAMASQGQDVLGQDMVNSSGSSSCSSQPFPTNVTPCPLSRVINKGYRVPQMPWLFFCSTVLLRPWRLATRMCTHWHSSWVAVDTLQLCLPIPIVHLSYPMDLII